MPTGEQPAAGPTRMLAGGPAADREVRHYTTALLAVILFLLVTVEWVLLRDGAGWDEVTLFYWESMIVLYCVSGLLANWRQPHNPFGLLMIWAGLTVWCAGLQFATYPGIALIGDLTQTLPIAALVHLVLAYPYGRLPDRTIPIARGERLHRSRWCCRHRATCSPATVPS